MHKLLLALALLITGCGSDNSGPDPIEIEGTWQGNFPLGSGGTGSLQMILDANLAFPRAAFAPGRSMQAVGVLVPNGIGGWVIKPRALGDVVLN